MRKIDILTRDAFHANKEIRISNTIIEVNSFCVKLYLHGNCIAVKYLNTGSIVCSLAGWNTPTTRSRLNAIGANIRTKKNVVYCGSNIVCDLFTSYNWFPIN